MQWLRSTGKYILRNSKTALSPLVRIAGQMLVLVSHTFINHPPIHSLPNSHPTSNPSIPLQTLELLTSTNTTALSSLNLWRELPYSLSCHPFLIRSSYRNLLHGFIQSLTGQLRRLRPDPAVLYRSTPTVQRREHPTYKPTTKVPPPALDTRIFPLPPLYHSSPTRPISSTMLSSYGLVQVS